MLFETSNSTSNGVEMPNRDFFHQNLNRYCCVHAASKLAKTTFNNPRSKKKAPFFLGGGG